MTNLDKMNALAGTQADKKTIKDWAFHNRIHVISLCLDEETFTPMANSVNAFCDSGQFDLSNEVANWDRFLDSPFIE